METLHSDKLLICSVKPAVFRTQLRLLIASIRQLNLDKMQMNSTVKSERTVPLFVEMGMYEDNHKKWSSFRSIGDKEFVIAII
jgi:hypothetical protein